MVTKAALKYTEICFTRSNSISYTTRKVWDFLPFNVNQAKNISLLKRLVKQLQANTTTNVSTTQSLKLYFALFVLAIIVSLRIRLRLLRSSVATKNKTIEKGADNLHMHDLKYKKYNEYPLGSIYTHHNLETIWETNSWALSRLAIALPNISLALDLKLRQRFNSAIESAITYTWCHKWL